MTIDEFGISDEHGDDMWADNYIFTHDPKPLPLRSFDWEWQHKFADGDDQQSGGCCATEDDAYEEARQHYLEHKDM